MITIATASTAEYFRFVQGMILSVRETSEQGPETSIIVNCADLPNDSNESDRKPPDSTDVTYPWPPGERGTPYR